jgi:alkylhydroperoxidase family enzyme
MLKLMGHSPSVLDGYLAYTETFENGPMPPRLRGLLTAAIAELSGSDYVLSLAYVLGPRQGVSADEVTAARRLESADPKIAAALRFAASVIRERGHTPDSELKNLQAAGYRDEEIVEIVGFIGLSLVRNYFNLILGTPLDAPLPAHAGHADQSAGRARASG